MKAKDKEIGLMECWNDGRMEYWKDGRKRLLRVTGCELEILKCCGHLGYLVLLGNLGYWVELNKHNKLNIP